METIWITGASGYSASFLASYLKNSFPRRFSIIGISRKRPSSKFFDHHFSIDLSNIKSIESISVLPSPKKVFHLAGAMVPGDETAMWMANVCGTVHLLKALSIIESDEQITIVNIGSAAEYSRNNEMPLKEDSMCPGESSYGLSKWSQTESALGFSKSKGLKVIVARTFNIIGPALPERLVGGTILKQILSSSSKIILKGNVRAKRDFVDIKDVVRAYWILSERGKDGHIYNICSGKPVGILDLVRLFLNISGKEKEIEWDENLSIDDSIFGSFEKINRETGWKPAISLNESIKTMIFASYS